LVNTLFFSQRKFVEAAKVGNVIELQALLSEGVDMNIKDVEVRLSSQN
jgi:uncharacterized protein YkvS